MIVMGKRKRESKRLEEEKMFNHVSNLLDNKLYELTRALTEREKRKT
jgi:hypothetical protein